MASRVEVGFALAALFVEELGYGVRVANQQIQRTFPSLEKKTQKTLFGKFWSPRLLNCFRVCLVNELFSNKSAIYRGGAGGVLFPSSLLCLLTYQSIVCGQHGGKHGTCSGSICTKFSKINARYGDVVFAPNRYKSSLFFFFFINLTSSTTKLPRN